MSQQPSGAALPSPNVAPQKHEQQPGDIMMQQAQPVKVGPGQPQPQPQAQVQYQPAVQGHPQQQYHQQPIQNQQQYQQQPMQHQQPQVQYQPAVQGHPQQQYQQQQYQQQHMQNQQMMAQPVQGQVNVKLERTPLANILCPSCKKVVNTSVEFDSGAQTWLASAIICLCGCWCGCCIIPFSSQGCQHAFHKCSNCGYVIGEGKGPFF